jgi:hypothetical protein
MDVEARRRCGRLIVPVTGPGATVVACLCGDRRRRNGSPLGVLAHDPADQVTVAGETRR